MLTLCQPFKAKRALTAASLLSYSRRPGRGGVSRQYLDRGKGARSSEGKAILTKSRMAPFLCLQRCVCFISLLAIQSMEATAAVWPQAKIVTPAKYNTQRSKTFSQVGRGATRLT